MTETVLAPTPALLVAPRAVRLVNPRLTQLAEMALFDEPLASAPSPSASPSWPCQLHATKLPAQRVTWLTW